jgi:hypothetical protein
LEIPLANGGEVFWLDTRTVALVVKGNGSDNLELYAMSFKFEPEGGAAISQDGESSVLLGSFPTPTATNFYYVPTARHLVFSDYVYADGNLTSVKEQDDAWENRGNSALVYDKTYERHWDTWVGPKKPSLFSVRLYSDADHKWTLDDNFVNALKGTNHVRGNLISTMAFTQFYYYCCY